MQVYTRLQEQLGLKDHAMVLNVMLSKIATNLKVYGSCDEIITQTLNLFQVWHQHAVFNTPWFTFVQ
jgi:exportin-7